MTQRIKPNSPTSLREISVRSVSGQNPACSLYRPLVFCAVILTFLVIVVGAYVRLRLPLVLAAAHNGGAALLLVALVMLNFTVFKRPNRQD